LNQQESQFDFPDGDAPAPLEVGKVRRVPEPRLKVSTGTDTPRARAAKADFCRQARRLRAAYANDPVHMYERLKLLTAAPEAHEKVSEPASFQPDAEDVFAPYTLLDAADPPMDDEDESDDLPGERAFRQLVAGRLVGRGAVILRYSERLELLKEAKRVGLDRFNANLIIAAVENEAREIAPTLALPVKKSRVRGWLVMVAAVQSFIVAGVWRLLRG
jgi:hypothetical protein